MKYSGYSTEVTRQISIWRNIHTRHSNAIAKAMAENWRFPVYFMPGISLDNDMKDPKKD